LLAINAVAAERQQPQNAKPAHRQETEQIVRRRVENKHSIGNAPSENRLTKKWTDGFALLSDRSETARQSTDFFILLLLKSEVLGGLAAYGEEDGGADLHVGVKLLHTGLKSNRENEYRKQKLILVPLSEEVNTKKVVEQSSKTQG